MPISKVVLAVAAFAMTACAAPKSNPTTDTAAAGAAAGQAPGSDSQRTTGTARGSGARDSVGRNPIDTARVGKDTGRQSQNPNKQP